MYQKILVPVDESEAAMRALHEACQLAQSTNAAIYAVHILEYAQVAWSNTGLVQQDAQQPQDAVIERTKQIFQQYQVNGETEVLNNTGEKIAQIIVRKAQENACDLIIMGTHGLTGVMHLLMGSVAEGVLRASKIPVMLIRHA